MYSSCWPTLPHEFAESLHLIAEGKVDVSPLITGTVGLEGVSDAFAELANPERHAKVLVDPWGSRSSTRRDFLSEDTVTVLRSAPPPR